MQVINSRELYENAYKLAQEIFKITKKPIIDQEDPKNKEKLSQFTKDNVTEDNVAILIRYITKMMHEDYKKNYSSDIYDQIQPYYERFKTIVPDLAMLKKHLTHPDLSSSDTIVFVDDNYSHDEYVNSSPNYQTISYEEAVNTLLAMKGNITIDENTPFYLRMTYMLISHDIDLKICMLGVENFAIKNGMRPRRNLLSTILEDSILWVKSIMSTLIEDLKIQTEMDTIDLDTEIEDFQQFVSVITQVFGDNIQQFSLYPEDITTENIFVRKDSIDIYGALDILLKRQIGGHIYFFDVNEENVVVTDENSIMKQFIPVSNILNEVVFYTRKAHVGICDWKNTFAVSQNGEDKYIHYVDNGVIKMVKQGKFNSWADDVVCYPDLIESCELREGILACIVEQVKKAVLTNTKSQRH